jgi:hypothetical protein
MNHNPTCVMCNSPATTTAAQIPVCNAHWLEYEQEVKLGRHYRPFWIGLRRAHINQRARQRYTDMEALLSRVAELEAENERLRRAQSLVNSGGGK